MRIARPHNININRNINSNLGPAAMLGQVSSVQNSVKLPYSRFVVL